MNDLEITRLCAQAMGYVAETTWGPLCQIRSECGVGKHRFSNTNYGYWTVDYDPLHDDTQAMALFRAFNLAVGRSVGRVQVRLTASTRSAWHLRKDLNRAHLRVHCQEASRQTTNGRPCVDLARKVVGQSETRRTELSAGVTTQN